MEGHEGELQSTRHIPKMSIVIPTHNCLHYLKMCLASIDRTSVVDHELVIVCDCCTDGTQEWLTASGYEFYELTEVHPPSAEYAWVAWTYGFTKTTKEYVCFINDDQIFSAAWDLHTSGWLAKDKVIGLQLIEPGTAGKPWRGIIEKNFGDNFQIVDIPAFEEYCLTLPFGMVEHEGVDISTIWHREYFDTYMPEGWSKLGPTVIDETQPYVRLTRVGVYHFSNKSRTAHGDIHLLQG